MAPRGGPGGASVARRAMDYGPEDRHKRYANPALWMYGTAGSGARSSRADQIPSGNPFADQFTRYFPDLRARSVAAGHFLGEEAPDYVNETLVAFLRARSEAARGQRAAGDSCGGGERRVLEARVGRSRPSECSRRRCGGPSSRGRRRGSRRRCVLLPVAPVITGNITTRKRSTSPARSRDRDRLRLPIVLRRPDALSFIARTASTSVPPRTSAELAHVERLVERGGEHHLRRLREFVDACLLFGAELVLSRGDLSGGEARHQPVGVRSHQVRDLGLLAQPGKVLGPLEAPEAGPALRRTHSRRGT